MIRIYDFDSKTWAFEENTLDLVLFRHCGTLSSTSQCVVCGKDLTLKEPTVIETVPDPVEPVVVTPTDEVEVVEVRKPGRPRKV